MLVVDVKPHNARHEHIDNGEHAMRRDNGHALLAHEIEDRRGANDAQNEDEFEDIRGR